MLWLGVASRHLRLVHALVALVRMPLLRVVKFRHLWLAHCHVGSLRVRLPPSQQQSNMASMSVATANPEFDLVPLGNSYENHTTRRIIVDCGEGNQGVAFRRCAASVSHVRLYLLL
jgi:hypothetical protein